MSTSAAKAPSGFTSSDKPTWELYSRCIHCGMCLNQCPTYRVLGTEMDSPRGRIHQVLLVDSGRLKIAQPFVEHIDRCLGCRACETACPSGVQYGRILERARSEIEINYKRPWFGRWLRRHFYRKVLHRWDKLGTWATLLRLYQRTKLQAFARAMGLLKPLGLAELDALAPIVEKDYFLRELGTTHAAIGEKRARVVMLAGCIASFAFAELNRATIRVLTQNGIEVHIPFEQTCCGALHAHGGELELARELARRNITVMQAASADAIINNAAGCGAMLKEYGHLLENDPAYAERARVFSSSVRDVNEFLAQVGLRPPKKRIAAKVTYEDPCHLAHGQSIRNAPRDLLRQIGVQLVETPRADACCGSAGSYNITENDLSMKILDEKMETIASVAPEIIATANVGCMLQLRAGVKRARMKAEVVHVIELLDRAYS